ncbi:DUF2946 domain-containing protein [Halomonas maura]|uniref:DUF2946 domain-containing protein n=1 Tax=Halomonas maura TaxID=117606 RepID=UPI0025B3FA6E|nr:DUF2946 domain-containing protein [Halomonas maura]MDN3556591.1 DUF2946 domain-containing protein [Halomonas maura]
MTRHHALHRHSRPAARLALLAMLLLVAGPLVGQLSAAGQGQHAGHGADQTHRLHAPAAATAEAPAGDAAAAYWHAACGYCSLFQQMPVLSAMLPSVPPLPSRAITAPVMATRAAHGGPAVFPQAPTRAPPLPRS